MPVVPPISYPGVYIQEVKSEVRTIVPVETATTAFIGRALRGPVNEPKVCNSYADFERIFGGLWLESSLGYAVNQFFQNGGSKAVVVGLYSVTVQAKETVRKKVEAAAEEKGATLNKLKEAAGGAAAAFPDDPAKAAAAEVVKAVEDAAKVEGATIDTLKEAAGAAAPHSKASLTVNFQVFAAAANAVLAEAHNAAAIKDADGRSVKQAAQKKWDEYKGKHPAQEAARLVFEPIGKLKDGDKEENIKEVLKTIDPGAIARGLVKKDLQNTLFLEAKHPGAWGNKLYVRIAYPDDKIKPQLEKKYRVPEDSLFNLAVYDLESGATETFPNVTVVDGPRKLDKVLEQESEMIAVAGSLPAKRPLAHPDPETGKTVWDDQNAHDSVAQEDQATDGPALQASDFTISEAGKTGIYALEHADIFNLLYIPPYTEEGVEPNVLAAAATYCEKRRAMLLVDPPNSWSDKDKSKEGFPIDGLSSSNAAIYFPRIQVPNPLRDNQVEEFGPCGAIAGIFARTDAARGVWKAPAGIEATLRGVVGLSVPLTDAENGELNPLGINCLRQMPAAGYVVWGARTTVGDDRLANEWKYIPVRRTALYIEESLYRGTQWAVFEPNDEPLWSQLRLNIGVFMHGLFRQGAFQGQSPKDAYFVKCDSTTTTQADIDRGIVNIIVGFAPLKPAEFVILYIQQIAGQLAT
jgi:phage tail sheath protein FI